MIFVFCCFFDGGGGGGGGGAKYFCHAPLVFQKHFFERK